MIKKINVKRLKEAPYNPRTDLEKDSEEYKKIKESIDTYGYVEPIVWNKRTGNVVGGHQRLKVLKDAGETEIEVSVVDLAEEDEKQLNLALNKIKGKWDYEKLKAIFEDFNTEEIRQTGFSPDEVAMMLAEDDIEDFDFGDWEFEPISENYIITLKFSGYEAAAKWAEENGYAGQIKQGTHTTVIKG